MRRATPPTEIVLGFAAGMLAAFFVGRPFVWLLHLFGLTAREAYSTARTIPLGVELLWSRVFWGGAFGVAIAWFGSERPLTLTNLWHTALIVAALRTVADWFIVPMFYGQPWVGASVDALLTPVLLNFAWSSAATLFAAGLSLAGGTWGTIEV